jgi:Holliday junction resolvase RusA-like endonuclease
MITVILPGEPRGKGRPRSRVAWTRDDKAFVAVYTDADTRHYETALAWEARRAMRGKPPLDCPITLYVEAHFSVPKSWSTKKRDAALAGTIRPTGSPDWDNCGKVTDAFKSIVWRDDSLVVDARVVKLYAEEPMLRVEVKEAIPWTVELPEDEVEQGGERRTSATA